LSDDFNFTVKPGALYLVSTPIGNLGDITLRALEVLKQVDVIAAEDTRTSKILLQHFGIKTPMMSYHDFNKEKVTPKLIRQLEKNQSIAVITDAGTPGISDPAFYIVREAIAKSITIESIPGATAFVPALILSGLPTDRFVFEGFLPPKKGRKTRLEELAVEPRTMVFYESPYRIVKTLTDFSREFGDRPAVIVREISKKFEQVVRGDLGELSNNANSLTLKGEFVLVVGGLTRELLKERKKIEKMSRGY
jgi:16S rRNA (cytidine1402-2'-O)-methyltransferase